MTFAHFIKAAKDIPKQRLAVAAAEDEFVLEAAAEAAREGLIEPILIGNMGRIREIILKLGLEGKFETVPVESPDDSAALAVRLIREGKADILMKGLIETRILLKAVVNSEMGIKESRLLSHVTLFSLPSFPRLLAGSDCAMIISPGLEEKKGIIENAAAFMERIGIKTPKIAVLSAVEKVNPKLPSSQEAAVLAEYYKEEKRFSVSGPFALDNILSEESRKHKGIENEVAEGADVLIFPDLDAGNIFYKAAVFLGGAEVAGLVLGAKAPIVLTSRADSPKSKLNSIAMAMVYNYVL